MKKTDAIAKRARAHTVYKIDGKRVPGVTTILGVINKPALVKWANNLGLQGIDSTKYVDETATIGTLAHCMIQEELGGEPWDRAAYNAAQVDLAENALLKYYEWRKQTGSTMETIFIEKPLVSNIFNCGGTIDWYGNINGEPWLVDIKTSNGLWPEHVYQVSAYREMLEENGYPVAGVRLLRVGRTEDEGFEDHIIGEPELRAGLAVFTAAARLYSAQNEYTKAKKGAA